MILSWNLGKKIDETSVGKTWGGLNSWMASFVDWMQARKNIIKEFAEIQQSLWLRWKLKNQGFQKVEMPKDFGWNGS